MIGKLVGLSGGGGTATGSSAKLGSTSKVIINEMQKQRNARKSHRESRKLAKEGEAGDAADDAGDDGGGGD